jgi:hypothetical protein
MFPEIERVPPVEGWVRPVMDVIALSTSVSLAVTGIRRRVSSVPVEELRSLLATGASLTHETVMVPVAVFDERGQKVSVDW